MRVAIVQAIGQAHQMPTDFRAVAEKPNASTTRRIRSVKVAVINWFILPLPLRIPSATSLVDTTK